MSSFLLKLYVAGELLSTDVNVTSLAEFSFQQLCQAIRDLAPEADLTKLKWTDSEGEVNSLRNDKVLAVALRKLQRAGDGDVVLRIHTLVNASHQERNINAGTPFSDDQDGTNEANKSGLTGVLFQAQPDVIVNERNVSSDRSTSAARSASVANPQLTFTTTPISFFENSSDLAMHRSALLTPSVNSTPDVTCQKAADAATPYVGVFEDKALLHCKPEMKTVAPQLCALCASNQEFDPAQKEGHVMQHLELTGASTNQNPAMFFASIAEMWQRCFLSSEASPCADAVAMQTKNCESPKCHVAKKQRKHLRNHVTCLLCDEHVRITCKEEHIWEQHMAGSERFICGSCGSRGTAKDDLERSCAALHPDIAVDIKPLATSAQQYARQYELCFGTLPSLSVRPQRASLSGTLAPAMGTPEPIASATISTSLRSSSERRYSTRYRGERHNQTPSVLPPAKTEVERGSPRLAERQKPLLTASKSKAKHNNCSMDDGAKIASACVSEYHRCQICFSRRKRKNLRLHALAAHYDGPEKIFECSACGFGDNALLHTVVEHVRTQHLQDASAHVVDRRAKFTDAIKRCLDTCFPFIDFSATTTENAVNGKVSHSLAALKARPKASNSVRAIGSSAQTKHRFAINSKRKIKPTSAGVVTMPCQLCGANIVCKQTEKLAKHARTHLQHPEKVFACSKCGYGVNTQSYTVGLHIQQHHADDKGVRIIDRRVKLARKLEECYEACFPCKNLSARRKLKTGCRRKKRCLSTTNINAKTATTVADLGGLPGTSGYSAISRDNSGDGEELDLAEGGGNESDDDMPLTVVAVKYEEIGGAVTALSVSSEETVNVIAKVEPVDR